MKGVCHVFNLMPEAGAARATSNYLLRYPPTSVYRVHGQRQRPARQPQPGSDDRVLSTKGSASRHARCSHACGAHAMLSPYSYPPREPRTRNPGSPSAPRTGPAFGPRRGQARCLSLTTSPPWMRYQTASRGLHLTAPSPLTSPQQQVPPPPSNTSRDASTRSTNLQAASTSRLGRQTFGFAARFANAAAEAPAQKRDTTNLA